MDVSIVPLNQSTPEIRTKVQVLSGISLKVIMEYGSTPYIGMAPKKMAAPLHVYKMTCSKVCARF